MPEDICMRRVLLALTIDLGLAVVRHEVSFAVSKRMTVVIALWIRLSDGWPVLFLRRLLLPCLLLLRHPATH